MIHKSALPFLACAILAGCAQPYDTPAYRGEVASPPVTATAPIPPVPPASTLQLRMTGSVVGLPVVDQAGQPIGIVQAVAADRGSGQIRDLIIASPSFGLGYYIAVPAVNAQTTGDRVVLNAPAVAWLQAPRYGSQQLSEMYGPS
jgi:hypothetical protein